MTRGQDDKRGERWLDPGDDDALAEDQLTRAGLYPNMQKPAVDIERFVEQYLRCQLDQYVDLERLVQGQTEFFTDGSRPLIQLNRTHVERADAEQGTALYRVRMTISHEAWHVIKHSSLFIPSPDQPDLPMGASARRLLRCSNIAFRSSSPRGQYDRWEVEANYGMAALLMPKEFFRDIVEEAFDRANIPQVSRHLKNRRVWSVVALVSELLQVSKQAVEIRMDELDLLVLPGQERFAFLEQEDEDDSF